MFFTYGLRPHEVFKSQFLFNQNPPLIKVGEDTKTGSRTVFPLKNKKISLFELKIPEFHVNLNLPNSRLGHQISKIFIKYPFTAYELRTYYAVRCAENGLSIVTASKWMGHSPQIHWKNYSSYLSDIESHSIWNTTFGKK